LRQWLQETDREASKKSTVRKIVFTPYGDKFVSLNGEGSLYLHAFSFETECYPLTLFKNHKISDFCILDADASLIVCQSESKKCLEIVDLMTGETLYTVKNAGDRVLSDPERNGFMTFGAKSGLVVRHNPDLTVAWQKQVSKEDITACCWAGHKLRSLVLGFSDGLVKVYRVGEDENEWEPQQTLEAFVSVQGRKGAVTALKVHPETGAIYGASSQGNVKLLLLEV
jgi:WD40 repeat protein